MFFLSERSLFASKKAERVRHKPQISFQRLIDACAERLRRELREIDSFSEQIPIGAIFGRDHSTVVFSVEKVGKNIKTINNYELEINRLIKEIKG